MTQEERTVRPYLNLLLGLNYLKEELNGTEFESQIDAGISSGLFLELKKVLIGVSYDSPQYLNLKVGYTF